MNSLCGKTIQLRRVVVTGIGLLTPIGSNAKENWENARQGNSGIGPITHFDVSAYSTRFAGELKNWDPTKFFDRKDLRKYDPYIQFAIVAADEALNDAGLDNLSSEEKDRTGVYIGSGIGGIFSIEMYKMTLHEKGPDRVSPFFLPSSIANLAAGQVSIKHSLKGPNFANCTACATSTHSIGDSFHLIQRGDADIMVAGGSEYPITLLGLAGFTALRALSTRNDAPTRASRPFDKNRDGFVMAEGAAILVVEELGHALKRNAKIYAEVIGYGASGDAFHMTAPDPEASGAYRSMKAAVADAGISIQDIAYINAHGTSTELNDKLETLAIKRLFGEHAGKLAISSTKSITGHMLGATGAAEAAYSILAIHNSFIPPTINYETPDPDCDLDYVPNQGRAAEIEYALSNSFGFGGTNGSLIFKKFQQ